MFGRFLASALERAAAMEVSILSSELLSFSSDCSSMSSSSSKGVSARKPNQLVNVQNGKNNVPSASKISCSISRDASCLGGSGSLKLTCRLGALGLSVSDGDLGSSALPLPLSGLLAISTFVAGGVACTIPCLTAGGEGEMPFSRSQDEVVRLGVGAFFPGFWERLVCVVLGTDEDMLAFVVLVVRPLLESSSFVRLDSASCPATSRSKLSAGLLLLEVVSGFWVVAGALSRDKLAVRFVLDGLGDLLLLIDGLCGPEGCAIALLGTGPGETFPCGGIEGVLPLIAPNNPG